MKKYYVEGYFVGEIEAESIEDAKWDFTETDITDITIISVYEDPMTE